MFGGSKLGRGGGRTGGAGSGGNKRGPFPPPPPHRMGGPSSSNRLSMGSTARNRGGGRSGGGGVGGGPPKAVEETFSLVSGNNPLAFAMIIRLAPDLVEEIRKVESEGRTARIKFDSMSNNPNGNVIDVGGKEFRFTWSREFGDLCDIYEECQSGEDGNGLLVESGCAWRKLNVQRVLDESTTKHVKKLSEEAQRKQNSRRAIVLDHGNPSMQSQIKQLAAVEANPWRTQFKQKKEPPFKKRIVETLQVTGPPKSSMKSGVSSTPPIKSRSSASPLRSSPRQLGYPASPGNIVKNNMSVEEITPSQVKGKENAFNSKKETPTKSSTPGLNRISEPKPSDLQSTLITLLTENSKGMSLKALEKAVSDKIPNAARKIEPIIKKIAVLQASGLYLLKPGLESVDLKKLSSENGSSPVDLHNQTPVMDDSHGKTTALGMNVREKVAADDIDEQAQLNSKFDDESNAQKRVDILQHSPDLVREKKASDNSEGQAGSSSDSGSDSDSDSDSDSSDSGSDSGSHSKSRSRSRSPVGSGSGSSSDSESDASSSGKEGIDEDVDIMTSDDDKDPNLKFQARGTDDSRPLQNEIHNNLEDDGFDAVDIEDHGDEAVDIEGQGSDPIDIEGHGSDAVDTENDLEIQHAGNKEDPKKPEADLRTLSDHDELDDRQKFMRNLFEDKDTTVNGSFGHDPSDSSERITEIKSKRPPDLKPIEERSEIAKRSKGEKSAQRPTFGVREARSMESPVQSSPIKSTGEPSKGPATQMMNNRVDWEGISDFGSQKGHNQPFSGKPGPDTQRSARKSFDQSGRAKIRDRSDKPNKHGRKSSEKGFLAHEGYPSQMDNIHRDIQNEDSISKENKGPRKHKESSGSGAKISMPFDPISGADSLSEVSKLNETGQIPSSHMGNGRGIKLQRELSDLELGELREPLPEESLSKKQFDRKGSFKQTDNKSSTSDNCNSDLSKGKSVGKTVLDPGKSSPPNLSVGVGRSNPEYPVEDSIRNNGRNVQSQPQHLSGVDNAEVGSQFNKSTEASSKSRQIEARVGGGQEGSAESQKKVPFGASQQHETKRGASHSVKDSRKQSTDKVTDPVGGRKDTHLTESSGGKKRKRCSSDEDTTTYFKYDKDEPDLKGPIKDLSQYEDFVLEFQEKYESYLSLNNILENDRSKFLKMGAELEATKGKDAERYNKIVRQLNDSYKQCGTRHKKLKHVFNVLHEELKSIKQRLEDFYHAYTKD